MESIGKATTRGRVVALDDRIQTNLKTHLGSWEKATRVDETTRFLGTLVYGRTRICDADLVNFAKVIDWLVDQDLFQKKRLAPIIGIPLAGHAGLQRWMVLLYGNSTVSKEDLNEKLGFPMLIGEGDIPKPGWPDWVLGR